MITYHHDITQGTDEWLALRCGILTASEMHLIITPTLKAANNEKTRAHVYELLAQRVNQYVEPSYVGENMIRGHMDEIRARDIYSDNFSTVTECGFITNDNLGFTIGYSPDGLVGENGLIECKSRIQKHQMKTIIEGVPDEYVMQLQTGLLVTGRSWVDYCSFCGGMPMVVIRVYPDEKIQSAIIDAAEAFEKTIAEKQSEYMGNLSKLRSVPTERLLEAMEDIV